MYPIFTNQKIVNGEINSDDNRLEGNNLDIAIFGIYDGPANFENKYHEYFNENIKELKVEVMIEKLGDNISENITTSKISEFIINFEEDNK